MRGLYLITNDDPLQLLLEKLDVVLATGNIAILQYRRKKVARVAQPSEVQQIKALCEKYQVPFVINDDLALAEQFGLGVHLGQSDGDPYRDWETDRKSTRLNSSHITRSRMPSSA